MTVSAELAENSALSAAALPFILEAFRPGMTSVKGQVLQNGPATVAMVATAAMVTVAIEATAIRMRQLR